jgi:hypothetical protein
MYSTISSASTQPVALTVRSEMKRKPSLPVVAPAICAHGVLLAAAAAAHAGDRDGCHVQSARRFDSDGQRADHDERADEFDGQQVEQRPEVDRQTDTAGEDSDQCCQSRAPWLCERRKLLQYGGAAKSRSGPATAGS